MEPVRWTTESLVYDDSPERAGEVLRLVLTRLGKHGIAPNPINFSLFYDSLSGRNAALSEALDQALQRGPLTESLALELYRRFFWDEDKLRLEQLRGELRRLVMETLSGVNQAQSQANRSADSLSVHSTRLERGPSLDELRQIISEVLGETLSAVQNGQLLRHMLDQTRREVETLRDELERTRQQVTLDALTGLKNRRTFEVDLHAACERVDRDLQPLSLVLADIDHFKQVNDTHGHLIGDKVIRLIGALLAENVKGRDIVTRLGGEEFAVLLPDTGLANATRVGETLRSAVEQGRLRRTDTGETVGQVTVSVGVTVYLPGETPERLVERADRALYASKKAGRNRVTAIDPAAS